MPLVITTQTTLNIHISYNWIKETDIIHTYSQTICT